jgi:broad specificity phosphatase PhoE
MPTQVAGLVLCALLVAVADANAQPAALAPDASSHQAEESFAQFATRWMQGVRELEAEERKKPRIQRSTRDTLVTYRGYAPDFSTEVQATGRPAAPFVGMLQYTELLYSCSDAAAAQCTVASRVPLTEIFRYQDGRWHY